MQPLEPRFTSWVPLQVEWPEEAGAAGNEAPSEEDATDDTQAGEIEETSQLVTQPPVEQPAALPAVELEETVILSVAVDQVTPAVIEDGGIVWDIQTNRP